MKRLAQESLILVLALILVFSFFVEVYAPPLPIGDSTYLQANPYESNPTVGVTSGVVGLTGSEASARDGDFGTNINWRIGGAASGITSCVEMQSFENASFTSFTIGWIDIKINYRASATTDDRYRIVYQITPNASWLVLQNWTSSASAKFDHNGAQDERAWSNVAEPNDGVWNWTDIGNIKVRVETQRQGATEDSVINRFYLYEVWLSIYEGEYPISNSVSIQPAVVDGLAANDIFFVDVFVTNVASMHGFEFLIFYNTTVLTGVEYFSYNPFIMAAPSEINDDPWGNGTGYVSLAYSSYMGDPVGFTGSGPVARIYFLVDANETSSLHFQESMLSTTQGTRIYHFIIDGAYGVSEMQQRSAPAIGEEGFWTTPGLPEGVSIEPMPANFTTENYLNTTNPYSDISSSESALNEVDDAEGAYPLYVLIFGDEEERQTLRKFPWDPYPQQPSRTWIDWAKLQIERGDESLVSNFGIDIRILGFLDWDSYDNATLMEELWYELANETSQYLGVAYSGPWWADSVDAIIGITAQATIDSGGRTAIPEYIDQGVSVSLLKWEVYWSDENVAQHEVSHLFYADDHFFGSCAMSYELRRVTGYVFEDGYFWWVGDIWVLDAYLSNHYDATCLDIISTYKLLYNVFPATRLVTRVSVSSIPYITNYELDYLHESWNILKVAISPNSGVHGQLPLQNIAITTNFSGRPWQFRYLLIDGQQQLNSTSTIITTHSGSNVVAAIVKWIGWFGTNQGRHGSRKVIGCDEYGRV